MIASSDRSQIAGRPRVTVAAIVEDSGRFLFVEERNSDSALVLNQPAGHVEPNETLIDAVIRETLEETGRRFEPEALVGIYLWGTSISNSHFLRICFAGTVSKQIVNTELDPDIERTLWLSRTELETESNRLRSPLVVRCVDDFLAGERHPLSLLKSLLPG